MSTAKSDQVAVATVTIDGMHCPACAARVRKALTSLPGVQEVEVVLEQRLATVTYRPGALTPELMQQAVTEAGYTVAEADF